MKSRKWLAGAALLALLLLAALAVRAALLTDASSVDLDALTDPRGGWPAQDCRQDPAGLPEDQQAAYLAGCSSKCANAFVVAAKNAHQYWENASRVRGWALSLPVLAAVVAYGAFSTLRRWRRLWPGWALGLLSLAAAITAGCVLLLAIELGAGGPRSLRHASAALIRIQEDKLWEDERSCKAVVEQARNDPYLKFGASLEAYRGLGANLGTAKLPENPAARHDVVQRKLDDIEETMKSLHPANNQSAFKPPSSEPAVYDSAPRLVEGARSHWALAYFGPIAGRSVLPWWVGLLVEAFAGALVGWGAFLLVYYYFIHRRQGTFRRARQ